MALLGPTPLALMLAAQTTLLEGDEAGARQHYTALLDDRDGEFIGLSTWMRRVLTPVSVSRSVMTGPSVWPSNGSNQGDNDQHAGDRHDDRLWRNYFPLLSPALTSIRGGKILADVQVAGSLHARAIGYEHEVVKIYLPA